ncbi:patatin-like phospholipase family protein [Catenulispora sp. NF23]|uniref:Patatin-like phospholipase family protein n=1 Tax=Catenulispora pinistramenti TaxID=2705254 RepID=A0ABS5L0F2_9ACTN|nr:patatin-like phospholipase family protein [Catenulispora pinistramenti]MBS2534337.1 patatin-like phospholipase family protein [Catenulispora pinistramenti]MBS2551734.1 patatin-like phospholipase family protein [Catenulispora pinistramenti]
MASTAVRRGLVLGGGGMLGAAWMVGALAVLSEAVDWDPRKAEMIVGTSAGSVVAALLGAGATPEVLYEHQLTGRIAQGPLNGVVFDYATAAGGAHPERPKLRLGSGPLLARTARHPRSVPPTAVMAAAMPPGRGSLGGVGELVQGLPGDADGWSPHKALRIVALDFTTGERVTFGSPRAPRTTLAEAVTASCAIPGWFAPIIIDGRRYVDGGMWSATNVDVADQQNFQEIGEPPLDELYVLAPMAIRGFNGPPQRVMERVERRYRRAVTRRMLMEAQLVRADGTKVIVFCPTADDYDAIGPNVMDGDRRPQVLETAMRTTREQIAAQRAPA